ncbi:MAG: hypothetical protein LBV74_15560 [Tannerella sp.]|jgi:phosphate/sulfate permease|nr:hypothetical protein [Tannerella sp.]
MENELTVNQENVNETEVQAGHIAAERMEQLRSEQSLPYGIFFGITAAVISSLLWATITVLTGYQIGYMALAVGFIVGYGVRVGGKGIDPIFGIIGAVLALLGCLAGNLFSKIAYIVNYTDIEYYEIFANMKLSMMIDIIAETSEPIDLLFYGIAIYEGYRFSFRKYK